jgi:hypothetical protein
MDPPAFPTLLADFMSSIESSTNRRGWRTTRGLPCHALAGFLPASIVLLLDSILLDSILQRGPKNCAGLSLRRSLCSTLVQFLMIYFVLFCFV